MGYSTAKYKDEEKTLCLDIAKHFNKVSNIARNMMSLIGDWSDTENMLRNFGNRSNRENFGSMIDSARREDQTAFEQIKQLYIRI